MALTDREQEVKFVPEEVLIRDIDVLVIGGGLSGAFAAIKAREAGAASVVQVDKASMGRSGCAAQSTPTDYPSLLNEYICLTSKGEG